MQACRVIRGISRKGLGFARSALLNNDVTGTQNQIEWAEQIRVRVSIEFDRVAKALEAVAGNQAEPDRMSTRAMIDILEEKRTEVMAKEEAGYFIVEWQELRDQVRRLIAQDSRYQAIKARKS
jgi:hypothetical protein